MSFDWLSVDLLWASVAASMAFIFFILWVDAESDNVAIKGMIISSILSLILFTIYVGVRL